MNKSESKYFNTAIRMDEALMQLLVNKDFEYISIKEICEKAGVNRSTFYLHYDNTNDLLSESIQYMNEKFLTYFRTENIGVVTQIAESSQDELILVTPRYLTPYLTYIKENKKLFQTALARAVTLNLEETYHKMFQHVFSPIMEKFNLPVCERNYILTFYIHGIIAVINEWLKRDCSDSIEYIIDIIVKCVIPKNQEECE